MNFINPAIAQYAEDHTSEENTLLKELNRQTSIRLLQYRMLSGHYQGRLLSMLSCMIQPTHILEIGTFSGYSAQCLAEGLKPEGKLITIDCNEELETIVNEYVEKSEYANQIEFIIGDAIKIIPNLNVQFDLVFIDGDKKEYKQYFDLILPKVRKGVFIIADNVLWSGKVTQPIAPKDEDTKLIVEFNQYIYQHAEIENVLLPIRDGLLVMRKK